MESTAQIVGAVLVLIAFVLMQQKRLTQDSFSYLLLNTLGSIILGIVALYGRQWGFLLLEVVWGAVSLKGLMGCLRKQRSRSLELESPGQGEAPLATLADRLQRKT